MKSESQSSLDLAITRGWLLGADRERRNASNPNGAPVRIWNRPVKAARLSVAGLHVEMPSFLEAQEQFVRCYLQQVLTVSGGNVSWAARLARRNRTGFHRLLAKHKLAAADFRNGRHPQRSPDASTALAHRNDAEASATALS
jgi:DNA-binding NtrC family response regulator